jgi:DNA sulfur modification protein DndE
MQLNKTVEEQLRKLKSHTRITPNIAARLAFFRSIEDNYVFDSGIEYKLDGSLTLDKHTWLGNTLTITELLLKQKYPMLDSKNMHAAWASHVEHGASSLRTHRSIIHLFNYL